MSYLWPTHHHGTHHLGQPITDHCRLGQEVHLTSLQKIMTLNWPKWVQLRDTYTSLPWPHHNRIMPLSLGEEKENSNSSPCFTTDSLSKAGWGTYPIWTFRCLINQLQIIVLAMPTLQECCNERMCKKALKNIQKILKGYGCTLWGLYWYF